MLVYNPYASENIQNPYPIFKRLRDEAPVYHNAQMNFWTLSRYEDVCAAHRDPKRFISGEGITIEAREKNRPLLILRDPPDHTWHKVLVTRVFTPGRMAALDPFIRETAITLLEAMNGKEEVDFVHDFTVELPLSVIGEMLDIPREHRRQMHERINAAVARGAAMDAAAAGQAMIDQHIFFKSLVVNRREHPREDVIGLLMKTEVADDKGTLRRLSDDEIALHFTELAAAGHETVAKAIANGLLALHHFPEQRKKLQSNPSLIPAAVEELLRYDPPSQMQGRTTSEDVTLYGVTIPKGERVMLLTGSATRDERVFENPDVYDVERKLDQKSVYFGFGIHKCLGIHLARQEMKIALEELFKRYPSYEILPEQCKRISLTNLRGVTNLQMRPGPHV